MARAFSVVNIQSMRARSTGLVTGEHAGHSLDAARDDTAWIDDGAVVVQVAAAQWAREVAPLGANKDLQEGAGRLGALRPNGYFPSFPHLTIRFADRRHVARPETVRIYRDCSRDRNSAVR